MMVIASANGRVGIEASVNVLRKGGSAIDAVEAGIRLVEANTEDHSVGRGGYPHLLGRVELDASIMDGRDLAAGAVGAMQDYPHPISVARKVMEHLPHVFLVGRGAERFAAEMGFSKAELLTEEVEQFREKHLLRHMPSGVFRQLEGQSDLWRWVKLATDPERTGSTVNFIAQDRRGDIASGVSTSGWAWKYPGRIGDSPVIGAGNYADNRYGAAACTGMGEMAIRASTARSIILYVKQGRSLDDAARQAMLDLNDLGGRYLSVMNLIAMDSNGNHVGYTSMRGRTYVYQTAAMREMAEVERTYVPLVTRWGEDAGN